MLALQIAVLLMHFCPTVRPSRSGIVPHQTFLPPDRSIITLRAKLSGAVYCNRFCLWVCLCGVCYHENSKLSASIFTQLGLYNGSDRLQLIKFWPSMRPREDGLRRGEKFLAPRYYGHAARSVCVSPSAFFILVFLSPPPL